MACVTASLYVSSAINIQDSMPDPPGGFQKTAPSPTLLSSRAPSPLCHPEPFSLFVIPSAIPSFSSRALSLSSRPPPHLCHPDPLALLVIPSEARDLLSPLRVAASALDSLREGSAPVLSLLGGADTSSLRSSGSQVSRSSG